MLRTTQMPSLIYKIEVWVHYRWQIAYAFDILLKFVSVEKNKTIPAEKWQKINAAEVQWLAIAANCIVNSQK